MSSLGNKEVFARNLNAAMEKKGVDRIRLCVDLGLKYTTVTDWCKAKKYPRIDAIEMLANYFGVLKSDLIEEKTTVEETRRPVSDTDRMFALFGNAENITEDDLADVRRYADFVKERKKGEK